MTPVDRPAWPDQPDPGPHATQAADGSTSFDFFTPPPVATAAPVVPAPPVMPAISAMPVAAVAPLSTQAMAAAARLDPPTLELGPPIPAEPDASAVEHGPATLVDGVQPPPEGPLFVIGDVHGYLRELVDGLHAQGLIDAEGHWCAGRARVWFLGDFTDRGPDGIGVIDLVMRLAAEAAATGGYCRALMGNHELLLLGADRYGDDPVQSSAGTASFLAAWRLNGGQPTDMERLEDHHVAWLSRLPAMSVEDDHLLVHSDTTAYLEYGDSVDAVNDAVHEVLQHGDADEWWDCFRRMTKRFAFRGESGPQAARELLATFGGHRIVHGHSPIPYLLGDAASEEGRSGVQVTGPHVYAEELAVAMDGGVTMEGEGRLLIARLPLS
ncbi:metallophosphoesterase [Streptacidiphilus sp. MAP12-20]|uniref:metallophosphoesterase n=1 Tax=Streptacidiphilus sp. MAP12-20 TaxID=3156299 RepID=UPI003518539D